MLSIDRERRVRFDDLLNNGRNAKARFFREAKSRISKKDYKSVKEITLFIQSLNYNHPGLTKEAYLAHPLRVGKLCLGLVKPLDMKLITLGLIHNVIEVTDCPLKELTERFGTEIVSELSILTIDRNQTSECYFNNYYQRIYESDRHVRLTKAIDKLDNMFMLCLNSNVDVRSKYLNEIRTYILPIFERDLSKYVSYVSELVENCAVLGHLKLE